MSKEQTIDAAQQAEWDRRRRENWRAPISRSAGGIDAIVLQLQSDPGRWAIYSVHRTRNAAHQRLRKIRASASFQGLPVQFRVRKSRILSANGPAEILVRWRPEPVEEQS